MSARPVGRQGPGAQVQQLHLVGVTTDHDSLIFSVRKGAKSGSFVLPLDDSLVAAVADAVRRMHAAGAGVELPIELDTAAPPQRRQSNLSPREIQDRLRGGRTLEEVATEAGVGEEWVARFAAPVEAERNQIVTRSRGLVYAKSRLGNSREPLGLSVRWNLADRGVRMTDDDFDSAWSAYLLNDATWMVTFSFVSRRREQQAEWEVDLDSDTLTSRNRLASDLGYVEPGRRRRSLTSLQPPAAARAERAAVNGAPAVPAPKPGASSTGATTSGVTLGSGSAASPTGESATTKNGRKSATQRKAPATKARARSNKKATAKKATAKKATAKKATARTSPAKKVSARKATAKKAPAKKVSASKVSASKGSAKKALASKLSARKAPATKVSASKVSAKKAPSKRVSARKAPARKAPAKRAPVKAATTTSRAGREVPPAPAAGVPAPKPGPNELGLRRLQMIGGANGGAPAPRPGSEPGGGYAARAAATAPAPRRDDWPPEAPRPAPPPQAPRPAPPPQATPDTAPRDAEAAPVPSGSTPAFDESTDPDLDVKPAKPGSSRQDAASEAEARRLERRRARAAAREPSTTSTAGTRRASTADGAGDLDVGDPSDDVDDWQAFAAAAPAGRAGRRSATRGGATDEADGDGRVVTIRANRATPPTNEGEVILPPDRPPLRPAQPAAQPKRRRFGRNGR